MTPKQLHAKMAEVVNAPGYPLLTHYREADFEVADLRYLENAWHPGARMLWIVRGSGTHLVPLGMHPRMLEEVRSIVGMGGPMDFHLLTNEGLEKIDQRRALAEASRLDWRLARDGGIFKGSLRVADIADILLRVERAPLPKEGWEREGAPQRFRDAQVSDVKLYPRAEPGALSLGDLIALRVNCECAAVENSGSLMIGTRNVRLGEHDLDALMQKARAQWLKDERRAAGRKARSAGAELCQ